MHLVQSCADTGSTPDLARADALVAKTLEIIAHFTRLNPGLLWFMENPLGKLRARDIVQGLPLHLLDYCSYGAVYRKRTCLWTNNERFRPRPLCRLDCSAPKHGDGHWFSAQRGGYRHKDNSISAGFSVDQLHALPAELCVAIFSSCSHLSGTAVARDP